MPDRLRIIVLGYIVRGPLAGFAWHNLQYVMGLAALGHDVWFVEDSSDYPVCYDPVRQVTDADPSYGLQFAANVFGAVDLPDRWAYYDAHTLAWHGPAAARIRDLCSSADLLLDLSPMDPLRPWLLEIPVRALVDTDPAFTQARHCQDPAALQLARRHTVFFSIAENVGRSACLPADGLPWQPTRQPVVIEAWPVTPGPADAAFTTIMQWHSYAAAEHQGVYYGQKSDSFPPYLDLPSRADWPLELALGSDSAPRDQLTRLGWRLRNPLEPSRDLWTYQQYIQESKGEFTVAKHGYVVSRSGWFSERSAVYLASGRPVVTQDTGFSECLPTGAGLLTFASPDEAVAALREVNHRYEFHCRAAREVAVEYFDYRKVLPPLIERAMREAGSL